MSNKTNLTNEEVYALCNKEASQTLLVASYILSALNIVGFNIIVSIIVLIILHCVSMFYDRTVKTDAGEEYYMYRNADRKKYETMVLVALAIALLKAALTMMGVTFGLI